MESAPKRQDMRIMSKNSVDYVEFQRQPYPTIPIDRRSVQYFGFSLTSGYSEKRTSHLWLLDGAIGKLLEEDTFSNYILMDEVKHRPHPNTNNILYVNLQRLSQANTQAGELAKVLVGTLETPTDPKVKSILKNLKRSFETFKEDKEVRDNMTRKEEIIAETRAEEAERYASIIAEQGEQIAEQAEQNAKQGEQIVGLEEKISELAKIINKLELRFAK